MTDKQLIELVERYSVLYNTEMIEYRDHNVRNNAWEEIAELMNTPGKFHLFNYLPSLVSLGIIA